jgi:hypothetical protein
MPEFCAPARSKKSYTCYTHKELQQIAINYNEIHIIKINKSLTKPKLWKKIIDILGPEDIWPENRIFKKTRNSDLQDALQPKMPNEWKTNKYMWLSTFDLNDVMKQYEKKYKDFVFMGAVPADCHLISWCELSKTNIPELYKKNKKTKFAAIMNIDTMNKSGQHWVGIFINITTETIGFFDSYGRPPIALFKKYIDKVKIQCKTIGINMKLNVNKKRFQYGGSECGVYSIYFILQSLEGKTITQIQKMKIPDCKMNDLRNKLYR